MKNEHKVVSQAACEDARQQLLAAERQLTKQREELARQRRALPWVRIDKPYQFETAQGRIGLAELFAGKSQLLVYHLMFAPEWGRRMQELLIWADSFDRMLAHLKARDVSFAAISRAPVPQLQAYARRLGWSFPWVSSQDSDFNYDFRVSFTPEATAYEASCRTIATRCSG